MNAVQKLNLNFEKFRIRELLEPKEFLPIFYRKCKIKILVVGDYPGIFGSFGGFSLTEIFRIMDTDPAPYIDFEVTKANRIVDNDADIDNFRFDGHDLSQYTQIWMIAFESVNNALSEQELEAVSRFMDDGGGVFANGDHAALGNAICARVPRIRSMRRWHYPNPGPNGEPVAPGSGADRISTLTDDPATAPLEQDQSDHVPQNIRVKYYSSGLSSIRRVKYPHPILCSPKGVIDIMPDHQHEGICEVPSDLSQTYSFNGYSSKEYPVKNNHQESPEIIAYGTNFLDNLEFGMIGTYDGHQVDVGRAMVDSTWHHWFDINLQGFKAAEDAVNAAIMNGMIPNAQDVETMEKYELIKDYYRNIAVWLSPKSVQSCIRRRGFLFLFRSNEIKIILEQSGKIDLGIKSKIHLGTVAKDVLMRKAPQCQVIQWICWLIKDFRIREILDPFPPIGRKGIQKLIPDSLSFLTMDKVEVAVLGGVVMALHETYNMNDDLSNKTIDSSKFDDIMIKASETTVKQFAKQIGESVDVMKDMVKKIG